MFIFAVRFNCKKWGSLYMSFWIHKVLDFNMLQTDIPRATPLWWGGIVDFVLIKP